MMAWKRNETEFEKSPNGFAQVKLLKNKRLGIKFLDDDPGAFAGQKFKVSEWPDFVKPKALPGVIWKIGLNNKHDGIFSIAPSNGFFEVKVKHFQSKEGQPPVPKFMDNWQYPDTVFFVVLEIVGGLEVAIGMEVFLMLRYRFKEGEDGMVEYTKYNDRSHTVMTVEFMEYTGADEKPLKYKDNILPDIQKRVLKQGKTFGIFMKDGWVNSLSEVHSEPSAEVETWEDESVEEKPKEKKKKAKKEESDDFPWDD